MRTILLTVLLLGISASQSRAQCDPIFILPGMEGGGNFPVGKAGWYVLREQALGIPGGGDLQAAIVSGESISWALLPPVFLAVDPDWINTAGLIERVRGKENWQADCPWLKAREWITNWICERDNPHYHACNRFPGACAVRLMTATWAKVKQCKDEHCWYDCTGYADVRAVDDGTLLPEGGEKK